MSDKSELIQLGGRVRMVRKTLGMTQGELAQHFGMSTGAISNIENGLNGASNAFIIALSREFNVNEIWLRTGEGEPFAAQTREEEIADFVGEVVAGEDDFKKRLINCLAKMSPDEWQILENLALKLNEENKANKKDIVP